MARELITPILWEDFHEGDEFACPWGRTITAADIANYAGVSGDFMAIHIDDEYAKATEFGQRLAHGPLTGVIALSMPVSFHLFSGGVCIMEQRNTFIAPVFVGDTLRSTVTVVGKRPHNRKLDRGIVNFRNSVRNQQGVEVLRAEYTFMIKRRPANSAVSG